MKFVPGCMLAKISMVNAIKGCTAPTLHLDDLILLQRFHLPCSLSEWPMPSLMGPGVTFRYLDYNASR